MGVGMTKVLHVKIPVTDLQRSADWYAHQMHGSADPCSDVADQLPDLSCISRRRTPMLPQCGPMSTPNIDPISTQALPN